MIFAVSSNVFDELDLRVDGSEAEKLEEPKDQVCQATVRGIEAANGGEAGKAKSFNGSVRSVSFDLATGSNCLRVNDIGLSSLSEQRPHSLIRDRLAVLGSKRVIAIHREDLLGDIRPALLRTDGKNSAVERRGGERKYDKVLRRPGEEQITGIGRQTDQSLQPPPFRWEGQSKNLIPEAVHHLNHQMPFNGAKPRRGNRARLAAGLLTSFLLGAAGVAVTPAVFGKFTVLPDIHLWRGANLTDIRWTNDPVALTRLYRGNRLLSDLDFAVNRSTKQHYIGLQPAAAAPGAEVDAAADGASASLDGAAGGVGGPETPPIQDGVSRLPSLYFDAATHTQVIGNFETRSFSGDRAACAEIAQSMVRDARTGQNSLYTLADTKEIKVMKICAANGMVMITCRNDRVTVSPRRPRPDDGCNVRQVFR
jgi:hypothetical protein